QHLIDHDLFPDGYEYPDGRMPPEPDNLDDIIQALRQHRASLLPSHFSDEDFRKFKTADIHASKERQVITNVVPTIQGNIDSSKCVTGEVPFTNVQHPTDGTLVLGNLDLYYGARPEQLDQKVRQDLTGHIIPSTQHDLPIVPNFCLEVKGPDGSAAIAKRQLAYDKALGTRGYDALRTYKAADMTLDNKVYTLGYTYQDGTLKIYTSHPIPPSAPDAEPGYVMTQLNSWSLTGNAEAFRQGAAAYRNGRDWAKQQRDRAIAQANKRAGLGNAESSQSDVLGLSFASEVSCVTI
ncbi:hypothetical protein IL306_012536, partial [Fusarium sp. DS 682]